MAKLVYRPGDAVVESAGTGEDGQFYALLKFPAGPPKLPIAVIFEQTPVRIAIVEQEPRTS
jgi:hypothetical protein